MYIYRIYIYVPFIINIHLRYILLSNYWLVTFSFIILKIFNKTIVIFTILLLLEGFETIWWIIIVIFDSYIWKMLNTFF